MAERTFDGQRICVVGGTAGIGKAIAQSLGRDGANVIIVGRDADKARRVAEGIGSWVEGRAADVTDGAAIEALFDGIGAIDHLVLTAAQVRGGMFRDGPLDNARSSMEGKFWSQYLCARHAQVSRSILLFSGTLSRKPMVGASIIGAINGAIEALGRSLAVELAPVRVNVIAPGLVRDTDAYSGMPDDAVTSMIADASGKLPARLVGDGATIAGVACALLASAYVTGATVDVDGGGLLV